MRYSVIESFANLRQKYPQWTTLRTLFRAVCLHVPSPLPQPVELIVFDFDGVFTDNRVLTQQNGEEAVLCSRGDGLGIDMLRQAGYAMRILSTETNPVVAARAAKLRLPVDQSCGDKAEFLQNYFAMHGIYPQRVIYMGNDINDLAAMKLVGYVCAPADAHPRVLAVAHFITRASGGMGAVRELADRLLQKTLPKVSV